MSLGHPTFLFGSRSLLKLAIIETPASRQVRFLELFELFAIYRVSLVINVCLTCRFED